MSDVTTTSYSTHTRHRAAYTLEMGSWFATCRTCGHRVQDFDRRQAASQFRRHIQEMNEADAVADASTIDLRDVTRMAVTPNASVAPAPLVG